MQPHAVTVPVITPVPIECTFWPEDDGWKGPVSSWVSQFLEAISRKPKRIWKKTLQEYVSAVLRDRGGQDCGTDGD
jgi:hypothetical protein